MKEEEGAIVILSFQPETVRLTVVRQDKSPPPPGTPV